MRPLAALLALSFVLVVPAAARSWTVDAESSRLGFEVQAAGQTVTGKFLSWTATIDFDPAALDAAKAVVTIDLTRVETGDTKRDGFVTGQTWLGATGIDGSFAASDPANPSVGRFETAAFRSTGANTYEADGTLTLRGSAQPVTLPFTLDIQGDAAHLTGRLTLDRSRWGIGQGEYSSGGTVANNVDVVIDLNAKAAP